jgi:histone deacetylase 8
MYLDLDLHFSDAVSQAFSTPNSSLGPQVLTFSVHHTAPGFFPVSELSSLPTSTSSDPFTLSVPLKAGASNPTFKRIWQLVEDVRSVFDPDYVVIQCGVDGLAGDPFATWNWSLGGPANSEKSEVSEEGSLGWCIHQILAWPGKKLLLGGGGYNSPNAARAWAYLTSIALGRPLSLETEIPDHVAFPLYAPSFTLDVPPGNMQDLNTDEYLLTVEGAIRTMIGKIQDIILQ